MNTSRPSFSSLAFALVSIALLATPAAAGHESVLGKWSCTAQSPDGELASVWLIREDGRALVVEVEIDGVVRPAQDVRLEGHTLTMKVAYQSVSYDVSVAFEGEAFTGTWTGNGGQGSLKGKRVTAS